MFVNIISRLRFGIAKTIIFCSMCFVLCLAYWTAFQIPYSLCIDGSSPKTAFVIVAMAIGLMFFCFCCLKTKCRIKCFRHVINILLVGFQIIWLVIVIKNHVFPATDLATDTTEAIQMLTSHKFLEDSAAAIYPGNRMHTLCLYWFYSLLKMFGCAKYWEASVIFNFIGVDIALWFASLSVKEIAGDRAQTLFSVICLICPFTYTVIPYYYASMMSLPYYMISFYCITRFLVRHENKIILSVIGGICVAIGGAIRLTAFFSLVAAIVFFLFFIDRIDKNVIFSMFVTVAATILVSLIISRGIIVHYDEYDRTDTSFPFSHGVMMSLQGSGGYLQSDVDFTSSFPSREEKTDANIKVIKQRLSEMGVSGYISFIGKKIQFTWCEGHGRMTNWYGSAFRYISGERRDFLMLYCQAFRLIVWAMTAIVCLFAFLDSKYKVFLPIIILLGGFVTHIVAESNPQYSVAFFTFLNIAFALGIVQFDIVIGEFSISSPWEKIIKYMIIFFAILMTLFWIENKDSFIHVDRDLSAIISSQTYRRGQFSDLAQSQKEIKQKVVGIGGAANKLMIGARVLSTEVDQSYVIALKNLTSDNTVLLERIDCNSIDKSGKYIEINMPLQSLNELDEYEVSIRPVNYDVADSLSFFVEANEIDYDPKGKMYINDIEQEKYDLVYMITDSFRMPAWSIFPFVLFALGTVLCFALPTWCFVSHNRI